MLPLQLEEVNDRILMKEVEVRQMCRKNRESEETVEFLCSLFTFKVAGLPSN